MRGLVRSAVQTSNAVARNALKREAEEKKAAKQEKKAKGKANETSKRKTDESEGDIKGSKATKSIAADKQIPKPSIDKHADRPKEFQQASTSAPRRLNDIAQAPPDLKKLPRGAKKAAGASNVAWPTVQRAWLSRPV